MGNHQNGLAQSETPVLTFASGILSYKLQDEQRQFPSCGAQKEQVT